MGDQTRADRICELFPSFKHPWLFLLLENVEESKNMLEKLWMERLGSPTVLVEVGSNFLGSLLSRAFVGKGRKWQMHNLNSDLCDN